MLRQKLLFIAVLGWLNAQSQTFELFHSITTERTYEVCSADDVCLTIHLNFYSPEVIDYGNTPYFFVSGWREIHDTEDRHNLVGIYNPIESMVLFVPQDSHVTHIGVDSELNMNFDTTDYDERFFFSLKDNGQHAVWSHDEKETYLNAIDFDKDNVFHTILLNTTDQLSSENQAIDLTDLVIKPFGNNDIFLEDFNVEIYSYDTDSVGNIHVILEVTNEYVIPSSQSSGGLYYILLNPFQELKSAMYLETYKQGQYISIPDQGFIHPDKKRFLVISDWSDSKTIGSFYIEKSSVEVEKEW